MGTISELRRIKGKRLAHKAASWLQRTYYRNFQKPAQTDISDHPLYGLLRHYRASEVAVIGPKAIVITGDSRMHGAEPLFEALIPDCVDTAISGDTATGVHKRLPDTVLAYDPDLVFDDSAGNDLLQKVRLEAVIAVKKAQASAIRSYGAKPVFIDVCPVGAAYEAANPGTIDRINTYNQLLHASFQPEEVLSVAEKLSFLRGPMLPEYDSGDSVHHSPAAYIDVYIPEIIGRARFLGVIK